MIFLAALAVHSPLLLMKVAAEDIRRELPHFLCIALFAQLVSIRGIRSGTQVFHRPLILPCPQQWLALVSRITGWTWHNMLVQFVAILLLALGVYRFSLLWVSRRAASFAALASVFLGSECFLIYSAGQLSTTFSAPLYLNALPYLYTWIRYGNWRSFLKGGALFTAAAAAHHATLLFGSFFLRGSRFGTGVPGPQ